MFLQFSDILEAYRTSWKGGPEIIKRLEAGTAWICALCCFVLWMTERSAVRLRGRKKVLLG
jgi:hypothetical protein